jgi:aldose sugar dehydrogenase
MRPQVRLSLSWTMAVLLASASLPALAQAQAQGQTLYQRNCASCHGAERQGTGLGPALSAQTYRYGGTRGDIERVIRIGVPSQGMPAFGGLLAAEEIAAIAAYLPAREGEPEPPAEEVQAAADVTPREFDAAPGVVDTPTDWRRCGRWPSSIRARRWPANAAAACG